MMEELEFNLKDMVNIKDINVTGTISAINISLGGVDYQVRYFYEGHLQTVYFFGFELEIIDD